MKGKISILKFVEDIKPYIFNTNEKYIKWPEQPVYEKAFNEIIEHQSAIGFILKNIIKNSIPEIDFWTLKKLTLDYLIYGSFAVEIIKLRNGESDIKWLDIANIRWSPGKDKIAYAKNWKEYKVDIKWYDYTKSINNPGVFVFLNPLSKGDYSTPYYSAGLKCLDTMSEIINYHNNNAKNGFTPNVLINFNNGEPDEDTKKQIEKKLEEKFTGSTGKKFLISYNDSKDVAATVEKLDNDNLDQKFESLQKFIQNQIMIAHQITSPQLIGVKAENQGFSKTEYEEAFEIFNKTVIFDLKRDIEFGLSKLFNKEIKLNTEL